MIHRLTQLFPLWALLFSLLAYFQPQWLVAGKPAIVPLLMLIMFGMGLSLSWEDFPNHSILLVDVEGTRTTPCSRLKMVKPL